MSLKETTVSTQTLFEGKVLTLKKDQVRLPDGQLATREYCSHVGAVCIVALCDDGTVLLERQYRYAVGEELIEIPAGKLDFPGEDPLAAAKRELEEETGARADEWIDLGVYYGTPAIMGEKIGMYLARGLQFGASHRDSDEFLEVFRLPLEQAVEMIFQQKIPDGKTQAGLLKAWYLTK